MRTRHIQMQDITLKWNTGMYILHWDGDIWRPGYIHVLFKYENNLHIFSLNFLLYYFQSGWEPILKETASKMFGHRTKNAMDYVYKGKDFHKTYQLVYAFTKAGIQVGKISILYFLPSWLPYNSSVLDKWRKVLEKKLVIFPPWNWFIDCRNWCISTE